MVWGPYLGSNMKNAVKAKAMIETEIIRMSAIMFSALKRIFSLGFKLNLHFSGFLPIV
jgi:hypothetical protein